MTHDSASVGELKALLAVATGDELTRLIARLEHDDRAGVIAAIAASRRREASRLAEEARLSSLYDLQQRLQADGFMVVAGVDEVGRGALAGPLSAGACVLPLSPRIPGLNDSKQLTPQRRAELAPVIKEVAVCWAVAHVTPQEIDELGVASALHRAMGRALAGLSLEPDHVIVDGVPVGVARHETAVVKGDSKIAAIAAASILAKVERDTLMVELAQVHPTYGFEANKGYGTGEHFDAIAAHGLSPAHRRSFCPGGGTPALF